MNGLNAELLAAAPVVIGGLVPVVRAWLKRDFTQPQVAHVTDIARGAVRAAEKLATLVPGTTGAAKLSFASDVVVTGAKRLGIKLTENEVLAFVHAALVELDNVKKAAEAKAAQAA